MHQFKTEQFLPIDKGKAWIFFSYPKNLTVFAPPKMAFKFLSIMDEEEIFEGMKTEFTLKPLSGITVSWQTTIVKVEHQEYFTSKQSRGPFKIWEHTQIFTELEGGTLMHDIVQYELPFYFIGRVLNALLVKGQIERIFHSRKRALEKLFR